MTTMTVTASWWKKIGGIWWDGERRRQQPRTARKRGEKKNTPVRVPARAGKRAVGMEEAKSEERGMAGRRVSNGGGLERCTTTTHPMNADGLGKARCNKDTGKSPRGSCAKEKGC